MEAREGAENPISKAEALKDWQLQLLPFMKKFMSVLAVAFFLYSVYYLHDISDFIEKEHNEHDDDHRPLERQQLVQDTSGKTFILETQALDRRYHHGSSLLMARIGTTQLTFMTGMVLAFMGAMLILGKMSEPASKVTGGLSNWHVGITSASPGIILSFFGTVLILTSLISNLKITTPDTPAYFPAFREGSEQPRPNRPAFKQPEERNAPGSGARSDVR